MKVVLANIISYVWFLLIHVFNKNAWNIVIIKWINNKLSLTYIFTLFIKIFLYI